MIWINVAHRVWGHRPAPVYDFLDGVHVYRHQLAEDGNNAFFQYLREYHHDICPEFYDTKFEKRGAPPRSRISRPSSATG